MHVLRIGAAQASAMEIYVLDPVFDEPLGDDDQQPFPGSMTPGNGCYLLTVDDSAAAWRALTDALNSADADGDGQLRDALAAIRRRLKIGRGGVAHA